MYTLDVQSVKIHPLISSCCAHGGHGGLLLHDPETRNVLSSLVRDMYRALLTHSLLFVKAELQAAEEERQRKEEAEKQALLEKKREEKRLQRQVQLGNMSNHMMCLH